MSRKIIDCIYFTDEIEMLEFRLNELYEYVDIFIIVESNKEFTGEDKISHFYENKSRFEKFFEKIIYLFCEIPSEKQGQLMINHCLKELYKKLKSIKLDFDNIICYSKTDEIPDFSELDKFETFLRDSIVRLKQVQYYHNLDSVNEPRHLGTMIFDFSKLIKLESLLLTQKDFFLNKTIFIENGWHFSNFSNYEKIKKNFETFPEYQKKTKPLSELLEDNLSLTFPHGKLEKIKNKLPKNYKLLTNYYFSRNEPKFFLIEAQRFSDRISLPKVVFYDSDSYNIEEFRKVFFINELKLFLYDFKPMENDFFIFSEYEKIFQWFEIKDNFLSDLLLN